MIIHPGHKTADLSTEALLRSELKWGIRQEDNGTLHFLNEILTQHGMKNKDLYSTVNIFSNRETATLIVSGQADAAQGTLGIAAEFGLTFINLSLGSSEFCRLTGCVFPEAFSEISRAVTSARNLETSQKIRWL